MSSALDMSLDDLIKNNKKSGGGISGGKGKGSGGPGPTRRGQNRSRNRPAPYSVGKATNAAWQHDLYDDQTPVYSSSAARASSIETGTKLYVSNLDYGVSNEDIKELFSEVGDLKRYSIHYDRSGRSKGTAEVVFARKVDALAAVKRYNNVQLDGKPMKIEIVGTNVEKPAAVTRVSGGGFGNGTVTLKSAPAMDNSARSGRRRRRGRGQVKDREPLSASDLDADLEKYHAATMNTE
ncbi:29 kDa ribonucleoprotein B, chloroplastic [Apostasia shenzhenica]|uniref:29 kDa ribonucleoprotein B, chloroplastic n=1 Tax=Apostasia shenzhenica TaxID=1088818 RepID=A0A2H9ZZ57_9ASPA|nr:29 kDa ribonucleoprotein B, chloroplastic [Apostasia shenzhenica]